MLLKSSMGFNLGFNSSLSSSASDFSSESEITCSWPVDMEIKNVNSLNDLERIINHARAEGAKKVVIRDKRSSPVKLGYTDLFGAQYHVSLLPDEEQIYEINFA